MSNRGFHKVKENRLSPVSLRCPHGRSLVLLLLYTIVQL